jgi:hypothetical protein
LVIKPKCNLLIPSLGIPEFHQSQLKNQIPSIQIPNFQLCSPFKLQHRQEHGGGRYTAHTQKKKKKTLEGLSFNKKITPTNTGKFSSFPSTLSFHPHPLKPPNQYQQSSHEPLQINHHHELSTLTLLPKPPQTTITVPSLQTETTHPA